MRVERVEVTIKFGFTENCYIVSEDENASHVLVIDPGAEPDVILAALSGRTVDAIVLTHRHYDHIGALYDLVKATGAEVIAHELDAEAISTYTGSGLLANLKPLEPVKVTRSVDEGDSISIGTRELKVMHTPGHSIGSMCLYDEADHILLSGDTLFFEALGRTDLATGSAVQQRQSMQKLVCLPDDTVVHPGHDADTNIGYEKRYGSLIMYR